MSETLPYNYSHEQLQSLLLWYEFIEKTTNIVRQFEFDDIPGEADLFAVFVDDRRHPYLEYTLRNVMHFLGPEWGLQLFVWPENRSYVESIVKEWETVHITEMEYEGFEIDVVDDTKRREQFWEKIKGEKQLFFDIDSLLCKRFPEEFLTYDYIGAPWLESYAVSPVCRIGSGGLSIRSKKAMLDISTSSNIRPVIIAKEDIFYSVNMQLRKERYSIPTIDIAERFAVEGVFYPTPFGLHKPWVCLSPEQVSGLLYTIKYY
jgi:hypothetical protein